MTKISPSFVGTTIATILASLWVIFYDKPFHMWTMTIRSFVLGGPVIVLIMYSIAWFYLERDGRLERSNNALGRADFAVRTATQLALGLALAVLSINLQWYIIVFMVFVTLTMLWSLASFKLTRGIIWHEVVNFLLCVLYAATALTLWHSANEFEKTFPTFVLDRHAMQFRLDELRGQAVDALVIMAASVGAIVANLGILMMRGPWAAKAPSSAEHAAT